MSRIILLQLLFIIPGLTLAQPGLRILKTGDHYGVELEDQRGNILYSPNSGLWSIASSWENNWPSHWSHAHPSEYEESGDWKILIGILPMADSHWELRDAYKLEKGLIKCVRRFEWKGERKLDSVNLSVIWHVEKEICEGFIPGLLYYGNPSEAKNRPGWVPEFSGAPGEKVLVEEHRLPMPFVTLENKQGDNYYGTSLHTLPSPVPGSSRQDMWWSAGLISYKDYAELVLMTGPVSYNGRNGIVKATQSKPLDYGDTWITVTPGTIIEKTFYLDIYPLKKKGTAFQKPVYNSIDIFKPYYSEDLPGFKDIMIEKFRFAKSRWIENDSFAGFNMYPEFSKEMIVMGWCGQAASPGYALQVSADIFNDPAIIDYIQKSLDHVSESPVKDSGFPVRYSPENNRWGSPDHVSQGQGLYNIGMAIRYARENGAYNAEKWERFFISASNAHAKRILDKKWYPRSTAEAFYIAPLCIAYKLYGDKIFYDAATKATDHFADRHLSMEEPYWGGTLDARGEDKEGAWAAFQGFLYAYEMTGSRNYLDFAKHALDVCLSYVVVWDIPLPPGRMTDHAFKTRGWTVVSPQNQHLDVYGVLYSPEVYKMGLILEDESLLKLAKVMFRSCGQIIDPYGSQGEQIQQTNFGQYGKTDNVRFLRGGYSEPWTVFWITAHFLNAGARFIEMDVDL
jgi:hypothetical protein